MGQRDKLGHRAVTAKAPADPRDLGWPFRVVPDWDGGGVGGADFCLLCWTTGSLENCDIYPSRPTPETTLVRPLVLIMMGRNAAARQHGGKAKRASLEHPKAQLTP